MSGYKKISAVEAKKMMDSESNIAVVDVRTPEEHDAEGYIFGSICIPLDDISAKAESILGDKRQKILVYCKSGKRSMEACRILAKKGYENVMDFGGIIDWNFELVY